MQHEIHFAAEHFHRTAEDILEVFYAGGISGYHFAAELFGEGVNLSHTDCHRGVGESDGRAFFNGFHRHFPCYRLFVEGTEDDASLAFQ